MATWTFIAVFLMACLAEIAWNHSPFAIHHHLNFDPTTIILNLFLSLIAAVQGSVIMIAQNQAAEAEESKQERERSQISAILSLTQAQGDEMPLVRQIAETQLVILDLLREREVIADAQEAD